MNARETVLGRVRDALAAAPARPDPVPRDYRRERTMPDQQRLALLTERLADYRADVHHCTGAETAATIAAALGSATTIGIPADLPREWVTDCSAAVRVDAPDDPPSTLAGLDAVVTGSALACAETGTIFLDGGPTQGRRALSLVPDKHVCVVDLSTVVVGVPEAVAGLTPTRPTTLISGPSATSDIELERVEGVHGPRTLIVILRTDR